MRRSTFSNAALLFIISAALWSISQASENSKSLEDCCLATGSKEIPSRIVRSYAIQLPGKGCKIHAVMFLTKSKVRICAPPMEKWVKNLMNKVNKKKKWRSAQKKKQQKSQNKRKRQA
ncbi:C-C motif chemokine 19-like [Heterodontus francisci]|uniref:C-C motif chemokine 19-like n=1 Tax=Heterodontus francisci TaxID=7792 RepID=UPI00355B5BA0